MSSLRATAAFFRISLNAAVAFTTDAELMQGALAEWLADRLVDMGRAW